MATTTPLVKNSRSNGGVAVLGHGQVQLAVADFTFSNPYPAGGETPTLPTGRGRLLGAIVISNPSGYLVTFNQATGKLMAFRQTAATGVLAEPTGVDLSAVTVRLLGVIA